MSRLQGLAAPILFTLIVAIALCACQGSRDQLSLEPNLPGTIGGGNQAAPGFPGIAQLDTRLASATSTIDPSISAAIPHAVGPGITLGNPALGVSDPKQMAWVVYATGAYSSADQPLSISLNLSGSVGKVWIGVSDYTRMRWEWHETDNPHDLPATVDLLHHKRYFSAAGTMYIALVIYDGSSLSFLGGSVDSGASDNLPPVWSKTPVIKKISPSNREATIEFWAATDPEEQPVTSYQVRYISGGGIPGDPATVTVDVPVGAIDGNPPYSFDLTGLDPATEYTLDMLALDTVGLAGPDSEDVVFHTTTISQPDEIWSCYRGNPQRTGCNPDCMLDIPLQLDWSNNVQMQGSHQAQNHLVLGKNGHISMCTTDGVRDYDTTDGTLLKTISGIPAMGYAYPALDFPLLAVGTSTGSAVANLSSGAAPKLIAETGRVWQSAPLLLGDGLVVADDAGIVSMRNAVSGGVMWQFSANPASKYSFALAADDAYIYAMRDDYRLDKLSISTGEAAATRKFAFTIYDRVFSIDKASHRMYLLVDGYRFLEINTDTLETTRQFALGAGETGGACAPALALHHDPPLAVMITNHTTSGYDYYAVAVNLTTGATYWSTKIPYSTETYSISVGHDKVFVLDRSSDSSNPLMASVFDLSSGEFLQYVTLGGGYFSELVLDADQAFTACHDDGSTTVTLKALNSGTITAPTWFDPNDIGLRALVPYTSGNLGDVEADWKQAINTNGMPTKYVLFYAQGHVPMVDPPYTDTTVIPELTGHDIYLQYTVPGLEIDKQYFAMLRAYCGTWGSTAVVESNTRLQSCAPPWYPGYAAASYSTLPSATAARLAGVASGTNMFMLYNDESSNMWLRYTLYPYWADETDMINPFRAQAFDCDWYSGNLCFATQASIYTTKLRYIERTAANTYSPTWIEGLAPDVNNDIALAVGSSSALAYMQYISGTAPATEVDYYLTRRTGGVWQAPAAVETNNLGGRDVDCVLNPSDSTKPWLAYQRGTAAGSSLALATKGELWFAWGNGTGYTLEQVDTGANTPNSDCGKRVRMALDASGNPHLAYLDLNAAGSEPRGQLKHAYHDGGGWHIETVHSFSLADQSGEWQHTYSEPSIAINPGGTVFIGFLERQSFSPDSGTVNTSLPMIFRRSSASAWSQTILGLEEWMYCKDRETSSLLVTSDAKLHFLYLTSTRESTGTDRVMRHFERPAY